MAIQKATSLPMFKDRQFDRQTKRTVVVFGVTRGGTSMVAGAVRGFGIHLGTNLPVNNEDPDFTYKPIAHMKAAISERNTAHANWGWKFPMAANYLDELLPALRNPILVIVARDVAATASALTRWHNRESTAAISEALLQTQKNFMLCLRWQIPALLVSYERATVEPENFLAELSVFLDLPLAVKQDRLLAFMQAGSYKSFEEVVSSG
jgi:hypothetical protein